MLSRIWLFVTPMDWSAPGSSVHRIFQARTMELVVISYSKGSSWPRDRTCISCISCICRKVLYLCTTWEARTSHELFLTPWWSLKRKPANFDEFCITSWKRSVPKCWFWECFLRHCPSRETYSQLLKSLKWCSNSVMLQMSRDPLLFRVWLLLFFRRH